MSISFPALLIYLLPGFLGLWVFKRSVQEDIDRRGESTQIAIALLLGISAIFLLFAVNFILKSCALFAEYISPKALLPEKIDEAQLILSGDIKFWLSYISLCLLSIFSGGIWAFISEKNWTITRITANFVNKCLGRWIQTPCESALRALVDEMLENKHAPSLVKVYILGENRDKPLIGWWNGYSESEKEIKLTRLELCDATPELKKILELQPRHCWINHNSGIVVEFLDWDRTQDKAFEEWLRSEYLRVAYPERRTDSI